MEAQKKIRLYIGIPTIGDVVDSQVHEMRLLEKRYSDRIEFVFPEKCMRRIFHDYARNMIVDEFLASTCDALWFLDSDVTPPENVLDIVTKHWDKWNVAGAPYPVFMTVPGYDNCPQVVFTVYHSDGKGMYPKTVPNEGTDYVGGLGTGCMFIKREILEAMPKPYFEFKYRQETMCIREGEDLGFCRKVTEMGEKFFIDYAMVCKHQKKICLLDVNNYAITYANQMVKAYDEKIRPQVELLAKKLKEKNQEQRSRIASEDRPGGGGYKGSLILPPKYL